LGRKVAWRDEGAWRNYGRRTIFIRLPLVWLGRYWLSLKVEVHLLVGKKRFNWRKEIKGKGG